MQNIHRRAFVGITLAALAACADPRKTAEADRAAINSGGDTPALRALIDRYADAYNVPRSLVHRVVVRESRYNPQARNGPYWGLMQISLQTAKGMGYQGDGPGLLDAETNLRYAVKYLYGAWLCADGSQDKAVYWYARGYYYEAKRRGILKETGMA